MEAPIDANPAAPAATPARGRGRRGGRGRGGLAGIGRPIGQTIGGRGSSRAPIDPLNDSGESADEEIENWGRVGDSDLTGAFPEIDDTSDVEDGGGDMNPHDGQQVPAVTHEVIQDFNGNPGHVLHYNFEPGGVINPPERSLEQFRDMSPTNIVLFWHSLSSTPSKIVATKTPRLVLR